MGWSDGVMGDGVMGRRTLVAAALMVLNVSLPSAQPTQAADPLQCWWRTSTGAIRIGEPFSVVLTCAALETDAALVVVDQSRLQASVLPFAPVEVLRGSPGPDLPVPR